MSNHLCSCCENSTLPLLQQTLLPHHSSSPLSDSRITSAHYLMARSVRERAGVFFWSCFTNDGTFMSHFFPDGTLMSQVCDCVHLSLSEAVWFIIHLCSCRGRTVISRKFKSKAFCCSFFFFLRLFSAKYETTLTFFSSETGSTTTTTMTAMSQTDDTVSTNNNLLHRPRLSLVCIPRKTNPSPEWWSVQCPDGPQPASPL